MIRKYLYLIFLLFVVHTAFGQVCPTTGVESIVNGGFESGIAPSSFGPHTLFVPTGSNTSSPGKYYIGYSSLVFNYGFPSDVHPHSGTKMLMIDASTLPIAVCWQQTIKVKPGQTYFFSAWLTSLSDGQRCQLQFRVKGTNELGYDTLGAPQTAPDVGVWRQVYGRWNSGSDTTAIIQLCDNNPLGYGAAGNDFAVDDISFFNGCGKLILGPKPNFGADSLSLCWGGGSLDLNTNVPNVSSSKFTWFKENVQLSNTSNSLPAVTQTGTYTVCVDSATCLNQAKVKVVSDFFVDLGPNLDLCSPPTTTLATGIVAPANFQITWKKDGNVIPGETGTTLDVSQAGTYKVEVIDNLGGLCHGTDSIKITSSVPIPHDVTFCPPATTSALLSVLGNGHYKWWDAATGGNVIGKGSSYLATGLANTTTFYVQDTTPIYSKAGLLNNSGLSGGVNNRPDQNFLAFKATQNCTIDTIAVDISFISANGPFTIQADLVDMTLSSTIDNFYSVGSQPAGQHYVDVPVGLSLIKGHNYQIAIFPSSGFVGGTGTMRYGNFTPANYPLVSSDIKITGGQAPTVYAGLFNWRLHMLSLCDRMPVSAVKFCPLNCVMPSNPLLSPVGPLNYCQGESISKLLTATLSNPSAASFNYEFFKNGVSVQAASTVNTYTATQVGNYSVTITDPANPSVCKTQTLSVAINSVTKPTASAGSNVTICSGSSASLTATGGGNYSWDNGNTMAVNTVNPTITTTYTVTVSSGASTCTDKASVVVTVAGKLVPEAGADLSVCSLMKIQPVPVTNPTWTCHWSTSVPEGHISNPNTCLPFFSIKDSNLLSADKTIKYILEVTDPIGGCKGKDSVNITFERSCRPDISIIASHDTICVNVTSQKAIQSYQWNVPSFNSMNGPFTVSPLTSVTYILTVTDVAGNSNADTLVVHVSPLPTAVIGSLTSVCENSSVTLNGSGAGIGGSYSWSYNNQTSQQITVTPLVGKTTYTLTVTTTFGCTDDTSAVITVNPLPVVTCGTLPDICLNAAPITLSSCSSTSIGGSGSYSGKGVTGNSFNPTTAGDGTIDIIYTYTDINNCSMKDTTTINVVAVPSKPLISPNSQAICDKEQITLQAPVGMTSYIWSDSSTLSSIVKQPALGINTYTVTITNGACTESDIAVITVNAIPNVQFTADTINGCQPLLINFNGNNTTPFGGVFKWNFGDVNSADSISNLISPNHVFNEPGVYDISLMVTTPPHCVAQKTISQMIKVSPTPKANFTYAPHEPSSFNPIVTFTDHSSADVTTQDWYFADPTSVDNIVVNKQIVTHTFSSWGYYPVRLIVRNEQCVDSMINIVHVRADYTFYAPNAFTPNNDGLNDVFLPKGEGIDPNNYVMYIYNRWGEKLFETTDIFKPWEGKDINNKSLCPEGVYAWIVIFSDYEGVSHKYIGNVTLLK